MTTRTITYLEARREALGLTDEIPYTPEWRFQPVNERFCWILDGDRAVGLLDAAEGNFELRVADPWSPCPPAVVPKYYHICTYVGLRAIIRWRVRGFTTKRESSQMTWAVEGDTAVFTLHEQWPDGTHGVQHGCLRYDAAWGRYVVEMTAELTTRRAITEQEFCNLIPVAIGDTRPGREKYQQTVWLDGEGTLRGMVKNPLWYDSVGAQDTLGHRAIREGGFIGWVAEPDFNPVLELLAADPAVGATTCDALMDEHIMIAAPNARHALDGWFHLRAHYRLFSLPPEIAEALSRETVPLDPIAMLAWKFQYAPHAGPIPADLRRVPLPGQPLYAKADFNTPVSWDERYFGQLWTPSLLPEADLYWDPAVGHAGQRSLRVTAQGTENRFCPGSGPTLHTEAGQRYRVSSWVRTQGNVRAWLEGNEILFNSWNPTTTHATAVVGPNSDWTYVETDYVACGEDAPFACIWLVADGEGYAWFDEVAFEMV